MKASSTATSIFVVIIFAIDIKGQKMGIRPCSLEIDQCTCTPESYQCSLLKDPLYEVPLDIPSTVTQVDLSGNLISVVTNVSFSNLNSLLFLNLNQNILKWIQASAFNNLHSLQTLDISQNFIEELDARHFFPFDNLQKLNITQNPNLNISINALQNAPTLTEIFSDKNFNGGNYDFSDLEHLETIHLEGCKVRLFYKDNFRNLPSLKRLLMSGNELVDLPVSILEQLRALEDLKLSGNFIRSIRNYNFSNNPKLSVLELAQNEIESLEGVQLNSLQVLRRLDLTFNKIKILSQNSLPNPPFSRLLLQLRGNPLVCDCNLKWLVSYSKSNPFIQFFGRCKGPEEMVGREPGTMEKSEFLCRPWQLPSSRLSHVVSVSKPVTLTCPVNGDPFPSVSWYYHNQTTAVNEMVESRFLKSTDQGDTVYFKAVTFDRAGLYICKASNKVGSTEVSIALTVVPLPGTAPITDCSCKKPVILLVVLFLTFALGIFAVAFVYRKYLKAARTQRNLAYATLNEIDGQAI